jgi:protein involved in polysaccharide export with SLBB domain
MKNPLWFLAGLLLAPGLVPAQTATPPNSEPTLELSYPLRPADKLLFAVREDPVAGAGAEELTVNPLGEATFRVSRGAAAAITLNVAGRTLAQVKAELQTRLLAEYYNVATIDLRLKETTQAAGKILFSGAVRANIVPIQPGERKTLFEALLQVGTTDFANLRKVRLSRVDPRTGAEGAWIYDAEAIRKDRSKDVLLLDGDRLDVPEKTINF